MCQAFSKRSFTGGQSGFTLVEIMAATTVLVLLLGLLLMVTNLTVSTVTKASSTSGTFSAARSALSLLSQSLSQASLNTYWGYYNSSGLLSASALASGTNSVPASYGRVSSLQFLVVQNSTETRYGQEVYFQAPEAYSTNTTYQSTQGLLNACGYFVRYGSDSTFLPSMMAQANPLTGLTPALRWRYRLMQSIQDTQDFPVYQDAPTDITSWATGANGVSSAGYPLADNIIALIVWPRLSVGSDPIGNVLTANYTYDSQANTGTNPQPATADQLPPTVQVTIVAIDEASASRIDTYSSTPPPVIESALLNKFQVSTETQYQTDLYGDGTTANPGLINTLTAQQINCRVFNTSIVLREGEWSQ